MWPLVFLQQTCAKIPNQVAYEVFVQRLLENLQQKFSLEEQVQVSAAVSSFLKMFDVAPLVKLLLDSSLLPEKDHSDIVHSMESTFKTRFQVLILAGLTKNERPRLIMMNEFCFDKSNVFFGQADTVMIPPYASSPDPEQPVLLIEFKNSCISSLQNMPSKWQEQIEKSQEFLKYSENELRNLQLKITKFNSFKTIGEQWNYAYQELQKNAKKLKKNFPGKMIVGFVIYRIGLHRVLFKCFDNLDREET